MACFAAKTEACILASSVLRIANSAPALSLLAAAAEVLSLYGSCIFQCQQGDPDKFQPSLSFAPAFLAQSMGQGVWYIAGISCEQSRSITLQDKPLANLDSKQDIIDFINVPTYS